MSRSTYWYAPGMMRPYWCVSEIQNYPAPGEVTTVANNQDSDTDMGYLSGSEFSNYFPHAIEISRDEYDNRSVDPTKEA